METTIYRLGGLRIASDFPLFGLQVCRNEVEAQCDVVIRCAPISERGHFGDRDSFSDGQYSGTVQRKGRIARFSIGWSLSSAGGQRNPRGRWRLPRTMTRCAPICLVPYSERCVISAELRRSMRPQSMLRTAALLLSAHPVLASQLWLRPLLGAGMKSSATTSASCNWSQWRCAGVAWH